MSIITSHQILGSAGLEIIEPAGGRFTAVEGGLTDPLSCDGCLFDKASFQECHEACARAKAAGLPDCEDQAPSGRRYVYVVDRTDPRQIPLIPLPIPETRG